MLEQLRRNSKNTIIYVLFGVIIAVFVINFGPGSRGCGSGQGASYAVTVHGSTVSEQDFHYAYAAAGFNQASPQVARLRRLKEFLLDKLIERELLVDEAERLGIVVSAKEAEDMVGDGRMMVIGVPRRVDNYVMVNGEFNYEHLKSVCQNTLGLTVAHFIDEQRKELMAERVRQLLQAGTRTTPDEVKADFESKERQVNLEFVKFAPRRFVDAVEVSQADIDAYAKAHEADLKKLWEERAYNYKKAEKQAHLERILVTVAKDAPEGAVKDAQTKIDAAKKLLDSGKSFAEVAKATSDDLATRLRGGVLGWRKKGYSGFGKALDDKIFAAAKGTIVGPERGDRGFEIVRVSDFREGDIPYESAASELAEEALRTDKAKERAKAEAEAAIAKVKAGGKLEELFPKPSDADEADVMKKLNPPPSLQETGMFARKGDLVPDLGVSAEVMKKAFALKTGELAGPLEASGSWAVIRVKDRKEPDMADFDKRKDELAHQYTRQKWAESMETWQKQRCTEARDGGYIKVNDEVLSYDGPRDPADKYQPCGGPESRLPRLPGLGS